MEPGILLLNETLFLFIQELIKVLLNQQFCYGDNFINRLKIELIVDSYRYPMSISGTVQKEQKMMSQKMF